MEHLQSLRPAIWSASDQRDFSSWDKHRDTLRFLYLDEGCSLKTIKHKMETEHGFPSVRLKNYETVFRDHFQFRKNLDQKDWISIAHRIQTRRSEGKASIVYLGDKLLSQKRVQRGTRNYSSRDAQKLGMSAKLSHLDSRITIKTPPPTPIRIDHCFESEPQGLGMVENTVPVDQNSTPSLTEMSEATMIDHPISTFVNLQSITSSSNGTSWSRVSTSCANMSGGTLEHHTFQLSNPQIALPRIGSMLPQTLDDSQNESGSDPVESLTVQRYDRRTSDQEHRKIGSARTRTRRTAAAGSAAKSHRKASPPVIDASLFSKRSKSLGHVFFDQSVRGVSCPATVPFLPTQRLEKLLFSTQSFLKSKLEGVSGPDLYTTNPGSFHRQLCKIERWYMDFNPAFYLLRNHRVSAAFRIFQRCFGNTRNIIKPQYPFAILYVCHQALRCTFFDTIGRNLSKFLLRHVAELCHVLLGAQHPLSIISDGLARMDTSEFAVSIGFFLECYCDVLEPLLGASGVALSELSGARGLTISLMEGTGMISLYDAKSQLNTLTQRARDRGLSTLHLEIEMASILQRNDFLDEAISILLEVRRSKEIEAHKYHFWYSGIIMVHVLKSLKDYEGQIRTISELADFLAVTPTDEYGVSYLSSLFMEIRHSSLLLVLAMLEKALREVGRADEADRVQARWNDIADGPN